MKKSEEIADPNSCLNKAADDELLFVLRSKDPAMAETVRFWVSERVSLGLNEPDDDKIKSALALVIELKKRSK